MAERRAARSRHGRPDSRPAGSDGVARHAAAGSSVRNRMSRDEAWHVAPACGRPPEVRRRPRRPARRPARHPLDSARRPVARGGRAARSRAPRARAADVGAGVAHVARLALARGARRAAGPAIAASSSSARVEAHARAAADVVDARPPPPRRPRPRARRPTTSATNVKSRVWRPSPKSSIGSPAARGLAEAPERHVGALARAVDGEEAQRDRVDAVVGVVERGTGARPPAWSRRRARAGAAVASSGVGSARPRRRPRTRTRRRSAAPARRAAASSSRWVATTLLRT